MTSLPTDRSTNFLISQLTALPTTNLPTYRSTNLLNYEGSAMKILIAGLGSIGRRHFRNLILLGEKDIVLYRTNQATLSDDELAGYPVETDLALALNKHQPPAVIVSNPTALHMQVAIPA